MIFSKAEQDKTAADEDVMNISRRLKERNKKDVWGTCVNDKAKSRTIWWCTANDKEQEDTDGIRDKNLLSSALETPFQTFAGEELFPSIQAKAARLCYGLVKNHAMLDGNKRIGVHAMLVFLALNGYELVYTQAELIDIILR